MIDFATRRRKMVDTQVRPSDVTDFPVINAMLTVPREAYVPNDMIEAAYMGENIKLGGNRVLLDPRATAKMLNALNLMPTDLVLDVGCAHGYTAAVMAGIVEAVVALEEDPDMAAEAEATLAQQGVDNVAVIDGALVDGAPKHGPYDAIFLEGAVETVPEALLAQLKEGGRIVAMFSEGTLDVVRVGFKIDGKTTWRFVFNGGAPVLPGFEKPKEFAF